MMVTKPVVLLAALTCVACTGTTPTSPTAGPGPQPADPRTAANIFNAACVQTLPNFTGTAAAVAAYPMTQHATFGTYYHNAQNLSVKLIEDDCSMVFGVAGDPSAAIIAFGTALNVLEPDPNIIVSLDGKQGPDGLFYVNARTTASQ